MQMDTRLTLVLIRHAIAEDRAGFARIERPDGERLLTAEGRLGRLPRRATGLREDQADGRDAHGDGWFTGGIANRGTVAVGQRRRAELEDLSDPDTPERIDAAAGEDRSLGARGDGAL